MPLGHLIYKRPVPRVSFFYSPWVPVPWNGTLAVWLCLRERKEKIKSNQKEKKSRKGENQTIRKANEERQQEKEIRIKKMTPQQRGLDPRPLSSAPLKVTKYPWCTTEYSVYSSERSLQAATFASPHTKRKEEAIGPSPCSFTPIVHTQLRLYPGYYIICRCPWWTDRPILLTARRVSCPPIEPDSPDLHRGCDRICTEYG